MSNQARWSVLQSFNLLKWHRDAHRAAVKALESGGSLSVVIRRIEEAMSSGWWGDCWFLFHVVFKVIMIPFSCFVCSLLGLLLFYLDIPVIMSRLIILAGQDGPCGKKSKVELVSYGFICSSLLLPLNCPNWWSQLLFLEFYDRIIKKGSKIRVRSGIKWRRIYAVHRPKL